MGVSVEVAFFTENIILDKNDLKGRGKETGGNLLTVVCLNIHRRPDVNVA